MTVRRRVTMMNQDYKALREIHDRLLEECRAIMEEHSVLQRKPFDADEHPLNHLTIRHHRAALAAYRECAQGCERTG